MGIGVLLFAAQHCANVTLLNETSLRRASYQLSAPRRYFRLIAVARTNHCSRGSPYERRGNDARNGKDCSYRRATLGGKRLVEDVPLQRAQCTTGRGAGGTCPARANVNCDF